MRVSSEAEAARWVGGAAAVTVLTGAGISTDSGIPDLRCRSAGVWTNNPTAQALFTTDNYLADPEVRRQAWRARLANPMWQAEPNAGHRALVDLERTGRLRAIVTQNIDGLHQAAGSAPDRVVEVHGTARWVACLDCDRRTPAPQVLARVEAGEAAEPTPYDGDAHAVLREPIGEVLPRLSAATGRA